MRLTLVLLLLSLLSGCGGGSGGEGGATVAADIGCTGTCSITTPSNLTTTDVNRIVSQAVLEAQTRGATGTIAVVDRVGNVLSVFRMTGAAATFTISGGRGVTGGLEGVNTVPSEFAAISKAITGAFLSSEGNAFTTRTASQIVQQNFNPHVVGNPGGPLFGVQFSSLSCSDVTWSLAAAGGTTGPHGSPLGLSADPGGLPLYKNGTVVGGIGVISDGTYSLDLDLTNTDTDNDELIAVAGTSGFSAPNARRADRITVDGNLLRFTDSEAIASNPAAAPAAPVGGSLVAVTGYFAGAVIAGTQFNSAASGYRLDNTTAEFSGLNAYVLVNGANANRYPPTAGTALTQAEVTRILAEAIRVANRTRAQIRQPLGSPAQVNISVVDTNGAILGIIRTPDAPVFGTDVAVQKARTAMFFSRNAAADLTTAGQGAYVTAAQSFTVSAVNTIPNGVAHSNRSVGNLARPFFPDGINANSNGPLSLPFASWSPFAVGLQLDLVQTQIVANLGVVPTPNCSTVSANGIQIFPGGFPIYRGGTLVGGIGISGDGIDQDDLVGFLGLANAGTVLGTGIAHAPAGIRADTINPTGGQLRYVNCPVAPFLDTTATNVCNGI